MPTFFVFYSISPIHQRLLLSCCFHFAHNILIHVMLLCSFVRWLVLQVHFPRSPSVFLICRFLFLSVRWSVLFLLSFFVIGFTYPVYVSDFYFSIGCSLHFFLCTACFVCIDSFSCFLIMSCFCQFIYLHCYLIVVPDSIISFLDLSYFVFVCFNPPTQCQLSTLLSFCVFVFCSPPCCLFYYATAYR